MSFFVATTQEQINHSDDPLALIHKAERERHSEFPQYEGHYDDPEWRLVRIKQRIRTKMGIAFEAGDIALGRDEGRTSPGGWREWTVYSVRNGVDTAVVTAAFEVPAMGPQGACL